MGKTHFVGVGGIGMSALAKVLLATGHSVSGSDLNLNNLTSDLEARGASIYKGHQKENVSSDTDLVVKSTCIRGDNPEIVAAIEHGIPVILRGELLRRVLAEHANSYGITGTHGKTTTTALVSHIIERSAQDPTVLIGGETALFKGNAKKGKSDIIVAEVDESDGYFRNISSKYVCITNIEREHMEHYKSMEDLLSAYVEFAGNMPKDGFLVMNGEDPFTREVFKDTKLKKVVFGINGDFDVTAKSYTCEKSIQFELWVKGQNMGTVESPLIGEYNIMNILAAVGMTYMSGFSLDAIKAAVKDFTGVKRRFDRIGNVNGIEVVEDYAHHPTEIRSVIKAAGKYAKGRVLTVFQPHRYSRTLDLMHEFTKCFYGSDILVLTDIYSAHEDKVGGVLTKDIYDAIDKRHFEKVGLMAKEEIPSYLAKRARSGDVILILGAGDVREISAPLVATIKAGVVNV